jgi:hypothetical protein
MMEVGYDVDRAPEAGEVIIDANGRLLKSSSRNHRFAIARIIGLSSIPLEIVGAHEDWPGADRAKRGMRELELAIKEVSIQNQ